MYSAANDPQTADDPQIGSQMIPRPEVIQTVPEMIPGTEMVFSQQMKEMNRLRNLDSGFVSFFFLKITNNQFIYDKYYR